MMLAERSTKCWLVVLALRRLLVEGLTDVMLLASAVVLLFPGFRANFVVLAKQAGLVSEPMWRKQNK